MILRFRYAPGYTGHGPVRSRFGTLEVEPAPDIEVRFGDGSGPGPGPRFRSGSGPNIVWTPNEANVEIVYV